MVLLHVLHKGTSGFNGGALGPVTLQHMGLFPERPVFFLQTVHHPLNARHTMGPETREDTTPKKQRVFSQPISRPAEKRQTGAAKPFEAKRSHGNANNSMQRERTFSTNSASSTLSGRA